MPGIVRLSLCAPSLTLGALPEAPGHEPLSRACLALSSLLASLRADAAAAHADAVAGEATTRLCWRLLRSLAPPPPPAPAPLEARAAAAAAASARSLGRFTLASLRAALARAEGEVGGTVEALGAAAASAARARACVGSARAALSALLAVSAARLGRGSAAAGSSVEDLARAAAELGEAGEALSEVYSAYALAAGRARALAEGAGRALGAVAGTLASLEAGAGAAGAGAVAWLAAALAPLQRLVAEGCVSLGLEMGAGAEALRCARDCVMTQQATSVRLLELAAAEDPPLAGGEECPVLLARLAALEATLEGADAEWALFERQLGPASAWMQSLSCALLAWAAHIVPPCEDGAPEAAAAAVAAAEEGARALPRTLEGLRKRAAGGALQDRGLRERARAAWDKYAAAAQHQAASAAQLHGGESALQEAAAGGSGALSPTLALHARFTAATLGALFYFPVAAAQSSPTLRRAVAHSSAANPAPQCPSALLAALLQLPPGAAPSGAADTLAALAAYPSLPLLPPLAVSMVTTQAPLVVEHLGRERWHRWSVPVEQVVTLSPGELQAIALCPAVAPEGLPAHLEALNARAAEALLTVEAARAALATLPCLQALAALPQPGAPPTACALEPPVLSVALAALLLVACPDGEDCRAASAVAQAAAPWHCFEAALAAQALPAPRVCASLATHPLPSVLSPAEEHAAASSAAEAGFEPSSQTRAALGGAFLSRLARAEATLEVPLAEALDVFAATQRVQAALQAFQERQGVLAGNRRTLVVGLPVHAEREAALLAQGIASASARHKALGSTVLLLLDVCDQHAASRLPVLERAVRLLSGVHLPALTFRSPAVAVLKAFCDALLHAELLSIDLARHCLHHTASLLRVELEGAARPAPLPERCAPHLQQQQQIHQSDAELLAALSARAPLASGGGGGAADEAQALPGVHAVLAVPVSRSTLQTLAKDIQQRRQLHVFGANDTGRLPGINPRV